MHSAVRNVMRLFDRVKDFEKRVVARQGELGEADRDALIDALSLLARLLGPLAPHLAEELWIAAATRRPPCRRRGRSYRLRCRHEPRTDDRSPPAALAAPAALSARSGHEPRRPSERRRDRTALLRDGAGLSSLRSQLPAPEACSPVPDCGKGLDVVYDYELAARRFEEVPRSERPQNIWRFEELPADRAALRAGPRGKFAGCTPLIHADRLGAELGLSNLYLKDDST